MTRTMRAEQGTSMTTLSMSPVMQHSTDTATEASITEMNLRHHVSAII